MNIFKIFKEIGRNAHIDWAAIFILTMGTIIALAIGGVYLYNAVMAGEIQGGAVPATVSASKFDEKVISGAAGVFSRRQEMTQRTMAGYSGAGDPSI